LINTKDYIYSILENIHDPEIPVLTIIDLGIVRDVIIIDEQTIEIVITPTYSGCPAMDVISFEIKLALLETRYKNIKITYTLSPAWTTDWMSESGKRKLLEYGIAPPKKNSSRVNKMLFEEETNINCPQCNSSNTNQLSEFGSTACKSLYKCNDCNEVFDYFKCH
jgi:ring-1,2-phenylacetyl-CoA epoxidase subunit PaaD